jgi:hypothetical protein
MEDVPKEMLKMWKTSWEGYVKNLTMMQEQGERMFELLLTQSGSVREEAIKLVKEGISSAKEAQKTYVDTVQENIKKIEDLLAKKQ